MNLLVSFVFDCIGWFSAALQMLLFGLSRGNSDLAAALLTASCLLAIMACHDMLVARGHFRQSLRSVLIPLATLFGGQFLIVHLGSQVVPLRTDKIEHVEHKCYRTTLPTDLAGALADGDWLLLSSRGSFSPQKLYLADSRMRREQFRSRVLRAQGGSYHLKGRSLTFSMPDGSDPRHGTEIVSVVREHGWQHLACMILFIGYIGWATWLAFTRMLPLLRAAFLLLRRERVLLLLVCCFGLYFGVHQWRFVSQDDRMQMVTSRDDDGYMLTRLHRAAEHRTMDPNSLGNMAYGAISFYPFALPSYLAGHVGLKPSHEFLNIWVRGSKLLISLGTLVAVWMLGAGRFGRVAATAAVLLLATNIGFLGYSSFPFYPDVLMALLSTLSLHYMLKLRARWNPRAFSLAIIFAAMSVSVKFLTFLLFPFIIFFGVAALWRENQGERRELFMALARCGVLASLLCVAVFFLCNPYLAYNIEWMVPNYKMCGNYYSAESVLIVASTAATLSSWIDLCYRRIGDASELVLAIIAIVATPVVIWVSRRASAFRKAPDATGDAAVLLLFALLLQAYLIKSVTLASAIDWRLLLPVYPIFYLLAVWCVIRAFPSRKAGTGLARNGVIGVLIGVVALVSIIKPRLDLAREFFTNFGREPASSNVVNWLADVGIPDDARVLTSLQSWFPARHKDLIDGVWNPTVLKSMFYQNRGLPAVYVEDEAYYDQFFSEATRVGGFKAPEQKQLFEAGSEFYSRLRSNRLAPFVLAARGRETVATNSLLPLSSAFRAYVNPFAFSENLIAHGIVTVADSSGSHVTGDKPESKPNGLSVQWKAPTTVSIIHYSAQDINCPALRLSLEDAVGQVDVLPFAALDRDTFPTTEWVLRLKPPRDIVKLSVVSDDGTLAAASQLNALHVLPPAPVGLNATRYCFEICDEAGDGAGVDNLISWRPSSHPGLRITPQRAAKFVLKPRIKCDVTSTSIVLDDVPAGASTARCTYVFKDGTQSQLEGVERRTVSPTHVYFSFDCPAGKSVDHIECQVSTTADATLRQVHVDASPTPQEAGE